MADSTWVEMPDGKVQQLKGQQKLNLQQKENKNKKVKIQWKHQTLHQVLELILMDNHIILHYTILYEIILY